MKVRLEKSLITTYRRSIGRMDCDVNLYLENVMVKESLYSLSCCCINTGYRMNEASELVDAQCLDEIFVCYLSGLAPSDSRLCEGIGSHCK